MSKNLRWAVVAAVVTLLAGSVHAVIAADRQAAHPEWSAPPSAAALFTVLPYLLLCAAILVGAGLAARRAR